MAFERHLSQRGVLPKLTFIVRVSLQILRVCLAYHNLNGSTDYGGGWCACTHGSPYLGCLKPRASEPMPHFFEAYTFASRPLRSGLVRTTHPPLPLRRYHGVLVVHFSWDLLRREHQDQYQCSEGGGQRTTSAGFDHSRTRFRSHRRVGGKSDARSFIPRL